MVVFFKKIAGKVETMLYERIQKLSKENHKSLSQVAIDLGMSDNAIYKWKSQTPNLISLNKVADYFGVSVDYLLGRTDYRTLPSDKRIADDATNYKIFREKSNEDISEVLDFVLDQLSSENPALMFDGHELDEETKELLLSSLKNSYDMAKKLTQE